MARFLHRLGTIAAHKRSVVLLAWLALAVVMLALVHSLGTNTSNNLELPGTDSQQASDLLAARFPPQQNGKNPIVFHVKSGKITDSANKKAIEDSQKAIAKLPHVVSAPSPFSQQGAAQISKDKQTAFVPVLFDIGNEELTEEFAQSVLDAAAPARKAGMEVAAAGQVGSELSEPATESSEVVGLTAAMIILAFAFGTLAAMGLPILSAVFGLLVGLSAIGLLGHLTEVPTIAPTLATMIGLGVGIDYALFLVSRHRDQRAEGMEVRESIVKSVVTSGSAIVFAGGTVVIALVTLLVAGIPLVTSLGYASAFAVLTAVLAAITFLPALLSLLGARIDSLRLPAFLRPSPKPPDKGFWGAWARFVTTHPGRAIGLALLILLPLIVPFFSLELGQEDIGATPKSTTERKAYDLLADGFGVGYNGPLLVAVDLGSPAEPSSEYTNQYAKAQSLQSQLETEQADGQAQAADLQLQAADLEAEQARLEAQQATLEGEAADLKGEKAQLQRAAKKLKRKRDVVDQLRALVDQAAVLIRQEAKLAATADALRKAIAKAGSPRVKRRLEKRLDSVTAQQQQLKTEVDALKEESASLRRQAAKLGSEVFELAAEAADSAQQALKLVQQKNKLQLQAANAKTKAAKLQTQKAQLETLQVQAQYQQQQAENLKTKITAELTQAGGDERGTDTRLVALQDALINTVGVKLVSPPQINKPGDATIFTVIATTAPAEPETAELVRTIREYVIPQSTHGTDLETHVGGQTASYEDLASAISSKLALVIAAVIGLGFLVLMMAFRSVLVPAQAAIANVLSVAAAFGVVTACFQWGWGLGLVGLDTSSGTDPIASFVPLIMFAVLFGLSMDYQVFLMSQIEHHRPGAKSDREAIAAGLATGARVITAAALIMIAVFASFILNGDPTVKQFGVGLSVGVALAATTVLLLAPALLVLAGKGAWWVPAWADHFLPHVDIEGEGESSSPAAAKPATPRKRRKHDDISL